MTGINTVMLYSAKIFHFAGVTNPFLATVVVGVTNVLVTVLSVALVDSHGRRPLLLGGTLLMIGSLLVLSGSLLWLNDSLHWQAVLAVSAVLLFVAGFAVGLGAVVWVVLADITPVEIRSRAFSLFMGISYVCNILIAVYTLSAINYLGRGPNPEKDGIAKLYLILAGVAAAALLFISYRLPETSTPAAQAARGGGVMSEEHSALLLPQDEQDEYDRNTTEL
jgi:MFS transporter, SP family, galactose:H+ symporter